MTDAILEIHAGAGWQRTFQGDVDQNRTFARCRIDAHNPARDHSVARVDGGRLANRNVLGLCLGDPRVVG